MTDRLERAGRVAPFVNSERIRLAREALGLTQRDVLRLSGDRISAATLSQLEKGSSKPSAQTLVTLAETLEVPLEFFLPQRDGLQPLGFFRSLRSTTVRVQRQALASVQILHDLVNALEEHVRLPDYNLERHKLSEARTDDEIEAVANELRRIWELGLGPVDHVVRELERHGIVVARSLVEEDDNVDAFSVPYASRPIVVLTDNKGKADRSRFDAAHELGHLILHDDEDAGTKRAESEAHCFAAAFLMPSAGIGDELPSTADWQTLVELKIRWGTSIGALLRRAKTLGKLSEQRYVNAMKQMSARGRTNEPGENQLGPPEAPRLLDAALKQLVERGITLERLADGAGLPFEQLTKLIARSKDERPDLEI